MDTKNDNLVTLQECSAATQFTYDRVRGLSPVGVRDVCVQAGARAVTAVAFVTPRGEGVVVAQNLADATVAFKLRDTRLGAARVKLPPHSIATFIYDL